MEYNINMSPILEHRLSSFETILLRLEDKITKLEENITSLNLTLLSFEKKLNNIEKGSDEIHEILYKNRTLYTDLMHNIKESESADIKIVLDELHKNNEILLEQSALLSQKHKYLPKNKHLDYTGIGFIKHILSHKPYHDSP